jgi:3-oxoacyl-[acyl-carrier protein] reductase
MAVDVRDAQQVLDWVEQVRDRYGHLEVLVNNAGRAWSGRFAEQPPASIAEVIDVNVKGVLYAARAVLPTLLQQRQGVIVNVSSGAGLTGFPDLVTYCASKFAVVGLTESLDQEVRGYGVRVYGICPGRVATDMQKQYSGRKIGMPPERVATAILKLAGPHPTLGTGKCLTV